MSRLSITLTRRRLDLMAVGVITAAAVTGYASAAPTAPSVVTACATKSSGVLRMIDPAKKGTAGKCRSSERRVTWGVVGPQGATGAAGANGAAGQQGPAGAAGASGQNGNPGASGVGSTGPRGQVGPTGPPGGPGPVTNQSPGELTQTGIVSVRQTLASAGSVEADINFPLQIPGGVSEHLVGTPGGSTSIRCTGSASNPTAAPGHLCVYGVSANNVSGGNFVDPVSIVGGQTISAGNGTILRFNGTAGDAYYYAVWAVTAPS